MNTVSEKNNERKCVIRVKNTFKLPSLNDWYAGGHWGRRKVLKNRIKAEFCKDLGKVQFTVSKFSIIYFYNNRLDCDNNIPAVKLFVDTLKELGIIRDDSKKYFIELTISYDASLPYETGVFEVWEIRADNSKDPIVSFAKKAPKKIKKVIGIVQKKRDLFS